MSKKNIARSAIEGGRSGHNRYHEKEAERRERNVYRDYCRRAAVDPEIDEPADNRFAEPHTIGRGYRDFNDKLNPVKRWLESQVGRPWNNVKKDIVEIFDSRSTAGRHILEHIDSFVSTPDDVYLSFLGYRFSGELYVDNNGFLRQEPFRKRRW